ncbi:preprotein translocase subunit YajC [Novosphingobium sp. TH158]|uniref:preprotein translocase subunit YajC n=1 Tax=Novosphingobium sp. TH158 TaxID=2067455 RepID=UPI000C7B465C|nr:preprotein translocase subunit YajC [Novosphingobium sp. TH158]PLK25650.1 preprotein translocase subunit YajC [Novosphingobium sp. TH158]
MSSATLSLLAAGSAASGPPAWTSFLPLVLMFLIFWFLILRPQMRQQKALRDKIAAVKKGDQVVTGGGFVGKVVKADENYLEIELGQNMKVKALRNSILDVIAPPGAAND